MKILSYRYLPINIYIIYTLFVFFSLFLGPVQYRNMDFFVLVPYVSLILLFFCVFFIHGTKGVLETNQNNVLINKVFKLFIFFGLLISIKMWGVFFYSGKSLSLTSMGANYISSYDGYVRGQASIGVLYILNIFESSILSIAILFIFSSYQYMGKGLKRISWFIVSTYLLVNVIGSGKQKYLGDLIIFGIYSYLICLAISRKNFKVKTVLTYLFFFLIIFAAFSFVLSSRYSALGIDGANIAQKIHPMMYWDNESVIVSLFGEQIGFPIGMFLGYFTNGLYGLNLCLQLPFEWTYMLGNSYSLAKIIEVTASEPGLILNNSYPFRAESLGWGLDKWHSLFAWLASDVSFAGVILLAGLFGLIYGYLWRQCIMNNNPFARPLFIYLSLGVIFSFSNNQIMHNLSGVIMLIMLSIFYVLSMNKNNAS